jgi:nicotinate-nucleotide adenylyltransferase
VESRESPPAGSPQSPRAALAILGGTFDPVHNAHLAMARAALEHLPVKEVVFVPTGDPGYRAAPVASARDRVAMLALAIAGEPRFRIDERELAPGASGYTVDTLRSLRAEQGPAVPLYFLMGADQFEKLASWHRPDDLRRLASLGLFARPGFRSADPGVKVIPMPLLPISASEIRARAGRGENVADAVPPPVANYIARHRLYS